MKQNINHLVQLIRRAVSISPIYFLVLAIIFGAVCVIALRDNNEHMLQLRTALYQADKNNGNVQQALDNLQAYVTANMNTNLSTGAGSVYPPIQLEYTYLRLVQSQDQTALSANTGLYTAAQQYCQRLDPTDFSGHNRVPCIEAYVTSHGVSLPKIPAALYEFDFITPSWSPDLAGWTMITSILLFVMSGVSFVVRFASKRFDVI